MRKYFKRDGNLAVVLGWHLLKLIDPDCIVRKDRSPRVDARSRELLKINISLTCIHA